MSTKPNPLYIAAFIHEQTHIERQKKLGLLKWGLKYVFFPAGSISGQFLIKLQKELEKVWKEI